MDMIMKAATMTLIQLALRRPFIAPNAPFLIVARAGSGSADERDWICLPENKKLIAPSIRQAMS